MLKAVCTALPIEVSGEFFEVSVGFVVPGLTTVKRINFFFLIFLWFIYFWFFHSHLFYYVTNLLDEK